MAIFRCNKCTHIQEQSDGQVGETVVCPRCGNPAPVYSTLFFSAACSTSILKPSVSLYA